MGLGVGFGTLNRIAGLLSGLGAAILLQVMAVQAGAQPAPRQAEGERPAAAAAAAEPGGTDRLPGEFLILNNVEDFSDFLKKLKQPDWIFMRPGPSPRVTTVGDVKPPTETAPRSHVMSSVKIRGQLDESLAELTIDLELALLEKGPVWIPLGIESPVVTSAREGERELILRSTGQDHWDVLLEGAGAHRLSLALERPVTVNPDRRRMELAIPMAPSTSLELDVPRVVRDVDLGTGESVGKSTLSGGKGTRLTAHVSPRSRLTLDWSDEANSGGGAAPLLSTQVEMTIDANPESITTQSSWIIRCVRGTARRLEVQLDEADVVPRVKLEDQYLPAAIERNVLTIPLGEPLRVGETRRLFMETRRAFPPGPSKFYTFSGYPLLNAAEQSGAIAIHPAPNLWINLTSTQGLRRIDPANLPSRLRTYPGTSHAFLFLDQPFKLGIGVETSPPLFQTETVTRVDLDGEIAKVGTDIKVHQVRGRLFEIDLAVPAGMQLLSIGPPDIAGPAAPVPESARSGTKEPSSEARQVLRVPLTEAARNQNSFTLRLRGQEPISKTGELKLGLFAPLGGVGASSTVSLFADDTVSIEVVEPPEKPDTKRDPVFRIQPPDERPGGLLAALNRAPLVVLKSHQSPTRLTGRLTRHPRVVNYDTRVSAQVAPRWIDVRQVADVGVQHGSIRSLVVRVPVARADLWQVQAKETIRREELETPPDQRDAKRFRLTFDPPVADRSSLTFSFRVQTPAARDGEAKVSTVIPWVTLEESTPRSTIVEVTAAPGLRAGPAGEGWTKLDAEDGGRAASTAVAAYRLDQPDRAPAGFPLQAQVLERVTLPALVVPRALLRTVLGTENGSRTHAWYWVESHPSQISFRLPDGAQWIRARIDGRVTDQVERDPAGAGFILSLPVESESKPVLLEVEYQAKREPAGRVLPPELPAEAAILQTLWEVQVPWSHAVVGVPDGWEDENAWYWDVYVWKRRPGNSSAILLAWVSGSPESPANPDETLARDPDDTHSYLFGRSDQAVPLRPWVVSRALMVAVCSGVVLLAGFYLMFFQSHVRLVWAGAATLGLLAAIFAHPSALLLVLQSAVSGLVLVLLGLLIQNLVERARARHAPAQAAAAGPAAAQPPSLSSVGSDDSTAIRGRVSSTMDYAPPADLPARAEASRGSRIIP